MDHELKQRLIGAVVVTALAAIFVPMLFDDPVENSAQLVTEQTIPTPVNTAAVTANKVPTSNEQVLAAPDDAGENPAINNDEVDDSQIKPAISEDSLYAETPGFAEEGTEPVVDEPVTEVPKSATVTKPNPPVVPANTAAQDPVKQAIKPKAAPNASEQELLKKVQAAKLQQDLAATEAKEAKKVVSIKKIETPVVPKEVNPAKTIASAVANAKKPDVVVKSGAPSRWYIQVGSFSKKENALSLWEGLRAQGLPASLDTVQTDKGTTYRLRVGPELDGKKAAAMKARLDKQNINSILVSEQP
jgi:DedD protein